MALIDSGANICICKPMLSFLLKTTVYQSENVHIDFGTDQVNENSSMYIKIGQIKFYVVPNASGTILSTKHLTRMGCKWLLEDHQVTLYNSGYQEMYCGRLLEHDLFYMPVDQVAQLSFLAGTPSLEPSAKESQGEA